MHFKSCWLIPTRGFRYVDLIFLRGRASQICSGSQQASRSFWSKVMRFAGEEPSASTPHSDSLEFNHRSSVLNQQFSTSIVVFAERPAHGTAPNHGPFHRSERHKPMAVLSSSQAFGPVVWFVKTSRPNHSSPDTTNGTGISTFKTARGAVISRGLSGAAKK